MDPACYFNHAGTSWPKPAAVQSALAAAVSRPPDEWTTQFAKDRKSVVDALRIPDPSRLLLTPGCTSALAIAISDRRWSEGDRVVTSSVEHHALHRPLAKLVDRGVELIRVPRAGQAVFDLERFEKILRAAPPQLVALSAASNVTGECLPLPEIREISKRAGIPLLVDGAQVVGWPIFDLIGMDVDLFAFAGHKGPRATWGIGGLYVAPRIQMRCVAAQCELPQASDGQKSTMPGFCDAGSVDLVALASLAAGFRYLTGAPATELLETARQRAAQFREGLTGVPNLRLLGNDPRQHLPVVAVSFDGLDSSEAARQLRKAGFHASGGLQCAPEAHRALGTGESGALRFSFAEWNTESAVDQAIAAVRKLA